MLINAHYEKQVDQIVDLARRFAAALSEARVEYRIVGGLAVYLHVNEIDALAARLTRDIDASVKRADIETITRIVKAFGLEFRHVAGLDMLVDTQAPRARSAVHLIFVNEKVRPDYLEPVPDFSAAPTINGLLVAPVADLVRMKLTSFRDKDRVHIRDLDSVGLITGEIETRLPPNLRERLKQVRATE
ncbi:MAG TPA: hypothetical protein VMT32_05900 [Bryobacteraceae bacterium]|nr:hypothetical protein [Bryobacteraceae bacterium]